MAEIIADLHIAEAATENDYGTWGFDTAKMALKQSICEYNGVTLADLDTSLVYYGRHLDKFDKIYQDAEALIDKKIEKTQKEGGNLTYVQNNPVAEASNPDSLDLYTGVRSLRLTEDSPVNILHFKFQPDRNWEHGDIFTLNSRSMGARAMIEANMAISYIDGSTEYATQRFSEDGHHALTLVADSAKQATAVFGSISLLAVGNVRPAYLDSVTVVLTRNHDDNAARRDRFPSKIIN